MFLRPFWRIFRNRKKDHQIRLKLFWALFNQNFKILRPFQITFLIFLCEAYVGPYGPGGPRVLITYTSALIDSRSRTDLCSARFEHGPSKLCTLFLCLMMMIKFRF